MAVLKGPQLVFSCLNIDTQIRCVSFFLTHVLYGYDRRFLMGLLVFLVAVLVVQACFVALV